MKATYQNVLHSVKARNGHSQYDLIECGRLWQYLDETNNNVEGLQTSFEGKGLQA